MTRTEYMALAKILRNAPIARRQKYPLVMEIAELITKHTITADIKTFKTIALMELE